MREPLVPPDPPLRAGDILLRAWRIDDVDAVLRACQDPEIPRWIPLPQPYLRHHAEDFVTGRFGDWADGAAPFAIVDAATGRLLGAITLHPREGSHASVGYWLAPEARGRGVMTRAVRLVSRWAFEVLPIARLQLYTLVGNEQSGAVARRAGFTREGILRRWDDDDGIARDVVMFSLIREDLAAGD